MQFYDLYVNQYETKGGRMVQDNILKDENFLKAAGRIVADARHFIYISTFKLELSTKRRGKQLADFFDLLGEKARSNVEVRILTNTQLEQNHVPHTNHYAIKELKEKGINFRYLPNNRIVHAKLLLIDNGPAILGSHNLSINSCHKNLELSYVINDKWSILSLQATFIQQWYLAKEL